MLNHPRLSLGVGDQSLVAELRGYRTAQMLVHVSLAISNRVCC